jgi:hypothetical protein
MMSVSAVTLSPQSAHAEQSRMWLRDKKWDLVFITLSVVVVPLPYVLYLMGRDIFGIGDDASRNLVNGFVAVAVGGPHMMSTFLRTGLDDSFKERYPMLIRSSIIIPIIVVSLAFLNLTLLLTIFFFWASLHVLHQVTYIVELYRHKEANYARKGSAVSPVARLIDYAVVLTCLFPIATYKISQDKFFIGVNDLGRAIPDFVKADWLYVVAGVVFGVALTAFIVKTVMEYRGGYINWPKTLFIMMTAFIFFCMPMLPNLDTAFQGANTWHSFQYLALTFYIIKIRQHYGNLDKEAPLVARYSKGKDSRGLYAFSAMLLGGSALIFVVVYGLTAIVKPGISGNEHFDIAYYTAILSFLWIHYYHDHFLFTDFEALDKSFGYDNAA